MHATDMEIDGRQKKTLNRINDLFISLAYTCWKISIWIQLFAINHDVGKYPMMGLDDNLS